MTGFKDNIIKLARFLEIPSIEFDVIGIHEWPLIMKKIEDKFVIKINSNTKFNWWWESFKGNQVVIRFDNNDTYEYLDKLIYDKEKVWFISCDSYHEQNKFWLFQGYIKPIQKILDQHYGFEYYLVSKKYEWLLCNNHHSALVGLGSITLKMQELITMYPNLRRDDIGLENKI